MLRPPYYSVMHNTAARATVYTALAFHHQLLSAKLLLFISSATLDFLLSTFYFLLSTFYFLLSTLD